MNAHEEVITFDCAGSLLVGVLSVPAARGTTGVLVVVGGPQYRAGSHRQFVLLARALAEVGIAVLRFDVRGMGDSEGNERTFDDIDDDIAAALDAFERAMPHLEQVVLYGLCDGASASLLYLDRRGPDARLAGLVLLNPWVRTDGGEARARVQHYYRERLGSREFWRKLLTGRVAIAAVAEALGALRRMFAGSRAVVGGPVRHYVDRMADAAAAFRRPILLVISGRDFTAKEFMLVATKDQRWKQVLGRATTRLVEIDDADHTFSEMPARRVMESHCVRWVRECMPVKPAPA